MAKTRSRKEIANSEPQGNSQTKMEPDHGNAAQIKAEEGAAVDVPPAAFKTAMSRFRHNDAEDNKTENTRNTRSHTKPIKNIQTSHNAPCSCSSGNISRDDGPF